MSNARCLGCRLFRGWTHSPRAAAAAAASIVSAAAWLGKSISTCPLPPSQSRTLCDGKLLARALPDDHRDTVRVRRVAADIIAAVREDRVFERRRLSERTGHRVDHDIHWRVHVIIDDNWICAFSIYNGEIVVYTGILRRYCRKDAHLATLLGHEVAHVIARHTQRTYRMRFYIRVLAKCIEELLDAPVRGIPHAELVSLFMRPWHFSLELEADRVGLMLLAAAGYDPRDAPSFYRALEPLDDPSDQYTLTATHPSSKRRVEKLMMEHVMGEATKVFSQAVQWRMSPSGLRLKLPPAGRELV
uniref:Peptidase M48 domain-containing protein n=1 Tax=Leersia perrieri TaxID=77586 RepID=A0A0D9VKP9_9ORYZ